MELKEYTDPETQWDVEKYRKFEYFYYDDDAGLDLNGLGLNSDSRHPDA